MPIYEYECRNGHRFEKYLNINAYTKTALCITCAEIYDADTLMSMIENGSAQAEKVWSLPANMQQGKPTVVFINPKTGESLVATSQYESPPNGFVKEELKSSLERTKFENTQNEIYHQQDEIYNEGLNQDREMFRKERIKQLTAELPDIIAAQSDNPSATESLMRAAISRERKPLKKRKTQFKLDVNHIDKSNL